MGQGDALGLAGGSRGELDDGQGIGVIVGTDPGLGRQLCRLGHEVIKVGSIRVTGLIHNELGQLRIDHQELGVGLGHTRTGLVHELLNGCQPHRQGQAHHGCPRQPDALHGGDQLTGARPQQGNVIAGFDTPGLQGGRHGLGVFMELGPRDGDMVVTADEGDLAADGCSLFESLGESFHWFYDHNRVAGVTPTMGNVTTVTIFAAQ